MEPLVYLYDYHLVQFFSIMDALSKSLASYPAHKQLNIKLISHVLYVREPEKTTPDQQQENTTLMLSDYLRLTPE
jgi:hypothetical protein